jgi:hypothetical protein
MIKDFDVMKQQLRDLAGVLKGFKSEADGKRGRWF